MAKINKQYKWDTCVHALCPFGRGFAATEWISSAKISRRRISPFVWIKAFAKKNKQKRM